MKLFARILFGMIRILASMKVILSVSLYFKSTILSWQRKLLVFFRTHGWKKYTLLLKKITNLLEMQKEESCLRMFNVVNRNLKYIILSVID